ncbi:MAG TPA: zinc-binding dehydrogenase [Gemmatimonadaceae bacterium]|nr:zinc-binding dehydrogenase [Gemmatimonadaceae bacterium]
MPLLDAGVRLCCRLKVVIEKVYKLEQAAEAHARIEQGHVVGRIVLEIR